MESIPSVIKFSFPNDIQWISGILLSSESDQVQSIKIQPFDGKLKRYQFRQADAVVFDMPDWDGKKSNNTSAADYSAMVRRAKDACRGELSKVVLSRCIDVPTDGIDIDTALLNLRVSFPKAFVYAIQTEEFGLWMGATPETLVRKKKTHFETMSLAGTKWGGDAFTEKELVEQQVVTESILNDLNLSFENATDAKEVNYGKIRHLQSIVRWQSLESLTSISQKLHPTPAVCGLPKMAALSFINGTENYTRELYTGYFQIEGIGEDDISFVNLRCMQLFRNRIRFYIGGGINSMSDPESEWIETEKKLETLLDAIKIER